jgi:hypothetical protein
MQQGTLRLLHDNGAKDAFQLLVHLDSRMSPDLLRGTG